MWVIKSLYIFHAISCTLVHRNHASNGIQPVLFEKRQGKFVETTRFRRQTSGVPDYISEQKLNDINQNQALIHWIGQSANIPSQTIFILTRKKQGTDITDSEFWRSKDYGRTWANEDDKFKLSDDSSPNVLISFTISPLDSRKVIFMESAKSPHNGSIIWSSVDEGETFVGHKLPTGFVFDDISFHPENLDWMLGYDRRKKVLFVSTDFAKTWQKLDVNISPDRYFWYIPGVDTAESGGYHGSDVFGEINVKRLIHFEKEEHGYNDRKLIVYKACIIPHCTRVDGSYSILMSKTKQLVMAENTLMVKDDYIFFQRAKGAISTLYVSYKRQPFVTADIPFLYIQINYHIVSSNQGFVMLAINHENYVSQLFSSNRNGTVYHLALKNIRYFDRKQNNLLSDTVYYADVHDVKGITGCFIANQHVTVKQHGGSYSSVNRTVITRNAGKTWETLSKPLVKNSKHEWTEVSSGPDSQLNLHLEQTEMSSGFHVPSIQTKESVPGYIIAHGSVGETLDDDPNIFNLYVSDDAGMTWRDTGFPRSVFVVSDSGAITTAIPMAPNSMYQVLKFSPTQGLDWQSIIFTETPVTVDAVLTEPGELTKVITIFGHNHYSQPWKIWTVNYTTLYEDCDPVTDYDIWSYASCDKDNYLGMNMKFKIRSPGRNCFNGMNFIRTVDDSPCPKCTINDYFCMKGVSDAKNTTCKYTGLKNETTTFSPIKAPGNKCLTEYKWPSHHEIPPETEELQVTINLISGDVNTLARNVYSVGSRLRLDVNEDKNTTHISWAVSFEVTRTANFSIVNDSHDLILNLDVPGLYFIHVFTDDRSAIQVIKARLLIAYSMLYCPPYTHTNVINTMQLKLSEEDQEWITDKRTAYGIRSFHWFGELPAHTVSSNEIHINVTYKTERKSGLVVEVESDFQLPSASTATCVTYIDNEVGILKLKLANSSFYATNDKYISDLEYIVKTSIMKIGAVSDLMERESITLIAYVPPVTAIDVIYLYLVPDKTKILPQDKPDITRIIEEFGAEILKPSSFILETSDQIMPHPLSSIFYIDQDGNEVNMMQTSKLWATIGIILSLIAIIILCYKGLPWLYNKITTRRYANLRSNYDDTQAIIDQVYIDDDPAN